jgi:transposase
VRIERSVGNDLSAICTLLGSLGGTPHVVVESTFNWYWLADGLIERGFDVTLAHPFALRAITDARVKTDRRAARTLAQVHRLGAIPRAAIVPKAHRIVRDCVRRRIHLVRQRATEIGSLRRLFMRAGRLDAAQWSAERFASPGADVVMTHPLEQLEVRQHRERYAWFTEQIDVLESAVVPEAKAVDAECFKLLQTMPGISTILALTIQFECGDIARFRSVKAFSSYCRVVPGVYQSGTVKRRRGEQSKQGNPYLKWAFNQAALRAVRHYAGPRRCFEKHLAAHAGPAGKVIVYNTVAHKLAVGAYRVMRDGVAYEEERLFGTA